MRMMEQIHVYDPENQPTESQKNALIDFLFDQLEEYGDPKPDIEACYEYAMSSNGQKGGYVVILEDEDLIKGATIVNHTGMTGYIPENILVYIATHRNHRGEGLGRKVMTAAIERAKGDMALHVEKDNPAKYLYEKLGFTNPYLEMRLKK